MRRSQPMVILLIIVMAIILAAGSFLAMTYMRGRPSVPAAGAVVNVEGIDVTLNADPDKEARVVDISGISQIPQSAAPDTQPQTENPTEPEPTPTFEAPTPTPEPQPTAAPEPVIYVPYTVQSNDSLYHIATRIDTSIALMARYGISQRDLVPGSVIELPVGNPAYCPRADQQPYAVGEADTAFSISRGFNITTDQLRDMNGLDADFTVFAATVICVPR